MDEALKRVVLGKVARRLLPFLFLLYVVNILDRVNVGFARLQMLDDLGLGEDVYALGAGIFYVGYLAFEVPSNLILSRVGARRWLARIMVSWGLITCAMMAVKGPWGFYALRILLGVAEAGFFPGVILYLTYWFPARERARAVAFFMAASPLTGALGSPLSGAIMQHLDSVGGLRGWQWLFLLEGAPAVLLGFVVLRYLTDRPDQAGWLTPDERSWLAAQLAEEEKRFGHPARARPTAERTSDQPLPSQPVSTITERTQVRELGPAGRSDLPDIKLEPRAYHFGRPSLQAVGDPRVWLLILLYFTVAAGSNAIGFYLPKLLKGHFAGATEFQIGLLAAVPNVCAMVCMVLNGAHSDRTGERRWHVALPALLAAAGWAWSAFVDSPALSLVALTLIQVGIMSMLPTFWSLATSLLSGVAAAGGIALINSVGNLGGFIGPNVLGQSQVRTGGFTGGMLTLAVLLCLGAALAFCVRPATPPAGAKR
jgi:ACS family tartrate transporter-like MFS transporter